MAPPPAEPGTVKAPEHTPACDVAIIGAGLAGLASAVFLRRAGFSVTCLDAEAYPHHKVGESLDWSSPALLKRVGLSTDDLIADEVATYKRKIVVCERGVEDWQLGPPGAIRRAPFRFETVTLHVDRVALDQRIHDLALAEGTAFIWERAVRVETAGDRVTACVTSSGRRVEARWFIDASGTARFLARAMHIPWIEYGRTKVCLWTYFDTPPLNDGTTFFIDNSGEYLSWIWDIPISPQRTSIGFVLPAETMQAHRRAGTTTQAVLLAELARYPRFNGLLARQPRVDVESTSFRPYVMARVCGDNWIMAGEAASMPDPLTGNGVTSAIRHARYVSEALGRARDAPALLARDRRAYTRHVRRLGDGFNSHIENAVYRSPVRWGLGVPAAAVIYTFFGFFMNACYTRFDPRGPIGMAVFDGLFLGARLWVAGWTLLARGVLLIRR